MYVFKDGKIKARTRPRIGSTAAGARMRQCYYNPRCDFVCIGFSSNCCTPEDEAYNPTGWCCNESFKSCTYQCIYDEVYYPDDNPNEPSDGTSGDNTPHELENTSSTMDVEKDGLNPCNNLVYDKTVNSNIPSKVLNIVKNFDVRKDLNIVLSDNNIGSASLDGETRQLNSNTWEISLNTTALDKASQENIAATIIHEMLHIYLGTGNDPDHETMSQKYIIPMANALTTMGFNISSERAQALAWGGLQKTKAWKELVDIDKVSNSYKTQDIININS